MRALGSVLVVAGVIAAAFGAAAMVALIEPFDLDPVLRDLVAWVAGVAIAVGCGAAVGGFIVTVLDDENREVEP